MRAQTRGRVARPMWPWLESATVTDIGPNVPLITASRCARLWLYNGLAA